MTAVIILIFVMGYLAITLEHPLKLDKTVPALLMAALMWALLAIGFHQGWFNVIDGHENVFDFLGAHDKEHVEEGFTNMLLHHLGKTAEILVFLIGAMTIVEIVDLHQGFDVLKSWVKTTSKKKLLWILAILAFILSAIIDNLTATIVLITLLRKLIPERNDRLWFAGMIVIAANAGGAWSPIGDVTTTMLWIGKRVSALHLVERLVLPSIICMVIPVFVATLLPAFKGNVNTDPNEYNEANKSLLSSKTMLFLGLGMIVSVPIFKTVTHLPPYLGMMLALGVVWLVSEYIHPEEDFTNERKHLYSAHKALSRIEMSSILFFLGILMAVAALEALVYGSVNIDGVEVQVGTLRYVAEILNSAIPNQSVVIFILGILSAIIDNVPLVAASMGMYDLPMDSSLWHLIAYSAGTGGSMLIIGSAAGVAAMGMEKIDFIWYLKNITWLAAIGFIVGYFALLFMETL
ncbi:sodium:proton antiporter NhaD [Aureibaculum sp. A20]|uniref:Sodium:proton antiporter NhaD n=1 Tax=Aureibaculum flavum TaxID=2795986 RepID=A0ABS0WMQ7_9FLAO|nr:sodium:proton antiporter NhaD [Aureibaculum flavum]MBJ2173255.1 sodium:proton antiporter NhaD [Aureibaculum flavum]